MEGTHPGYELAESLAMHLSCCDRLTATFPRMVSCAVCVQSFVNQEAISDGAHVPQMKIQQSIHTTLQRLCDTDEDLDDAVVCLDAILSSVGIFQLEPSIIRTKQALLCNSDCSHTPAPCLHTSIGKCWCELPLLPCAMTEALLIWSECPVCADAC